MDTEFEFQLIFCISSLRNVKITLNLKVRLSGRTGGTQHLVVPEADIYQSDTGSMSRCQGR